MAGTCSEGFQPLEFNKPLKFHNLGGNPKKNCSFLFYPSTDILKNNLALATINEWAPQYQNNVIMTISDFKSSILSLIHLDPWKTRIPHRLVSISSQNGISPLGKSWQRVNPKFPNLSMPEKDKKAFQRKYRLQVPTPYLPHQPLSSSRMGPWYVYCF